MKERCKNCAFKANIEKWNYKLNRAPIKEKMPFYVCTVFWETEHESLIYMYHSNEEKGMCEMFTPKKNG